MDTRTLRWLLACWLLLLAFPASAQPPPSGLRIPTNPADRRTLTVTVTGAGSGAVTGPGMTSCTGQAGGDCTEDFIVNTVTTIHATAASGSAFSGWSGDCSGTGVCTVTMSAARNVTATFVIANFQLVVSTVGVGTIVGTGINCGADCSEIYATGTIVTLVATPPLGRVFQSWAGDCSGTVTTCVLTMTQARAATAAFVPGWDMAWDDNSTNEDSFSLERRTPCTTGSYSVLTTPAANQTTYRDTAVTAGVAYQYRIRAQNVEGVSAYSNELCATP